MSRKQTAVVFSLAGVLLGICEACDGKARTAVWESRTMSRDGSVVDVIREVTPEEFTRHKVLAQLKAFYDASRNRPHPLERLTIASNRRTLLNLVRSDVCSVGLPGPQSYWEAEQGAQVLVFQGAATAFIRIDNTVERIQLSTSRHSAHEFTVEGIRYRLSGFQLSQRDASTDLIRFWVVTEGSLTIAGAKGALSRLLELSGMKSGHAVIRGDYFFGTVGGPYLDVLRSPTFRMPSSVGEVSFVECALGVSGDRCAFGRDECNRDRGPRARP